MLSIRKAENGGTYDAAHVGLSHSESVIVKVENGGDFSYNTVSRHQPISHTILAGRYVAPFVIQFEHEDV